MGTLFNTMVRALEAQEGVRFDKVEVVLVPVDKDGRRLVEPPPAPGTKVVTIEPHKKYLFPD